MVVGDAYPKALDYIFQACIGKRQMNSTTLNNFNPHKTLGVGDQKLIVTYVTTANIKKKKKF